MRTHRASKFIKIETGKAGEYDLPAPGRRPSREKQQKTADPKQTLRRLDFQDVPLYSTLRRLPIVIVSQTSPSQAYRLLLCTLLLIMQFATRCLPLAAAQGGPPTKDLHIQTHKHTNVVRERDLWGLELWGLELWELELWELELWKLELSKPSLVPVGVPRPRARKQ